MQTTPMRTQSGASSSVAGVQADRPRSASQDSPKPGAPSAAKVKQLPPRPTTALEPSADASAAPAPRVKALPRLPVGASPSSSSSEEVTSKRDSPPDSPSAVAFQRRQLEIPAAFADKEETTAEEAAPDPPPKRRPARRSQQMSLSEATLRPMSLYQPPVRRPDRSELAQITKRMTMLNTVPFSSRLCLKCGVLRGSTRTKIF